VLFYLSRRQHQDEPVRDAAPVGALESVPGHRQRSVLPVADQVDDAAARHRQSVGNVDPATSGQR
jgi:hypothetical protein